MTSPTPSFSVASPQHQSMRARKKAQTRHTIAQSALTLFSEQGFDETTIDEIAAHADVSRRTFFRYFPSKEDAFFVEHSARLDAFRALLAEVRPDESNLQRVQRACIVMAAHYTEFRAKLLEQHRIIESSRNLMAYDQRLDAQWEEAIIETLTRPSSSNTTPQPNQLRFARLAAGAIMGMVRAELRAWFARGAHDDLVALAEDAFTMILFKEPSP